MILAPTDKPLVDALAAVFYVGSELEQGEHTLQVLRLIRRLRPDSPKLAVVEAQQLVDCGDLQGARLLLDEAEVRNPASPIVKAMLAFVLYLQKNGLWEAYADELKDLPHDSKAQSILDLLHRIACGAPFEAAEDQALQSESKMEVGYMNYIGVTC